MEVQRVWPIIVLLCAGTVSANDGRSVEASAVREADAQRQSLAAASSNAASAPSSEGAVDAPDPASSQPEPDASTLASPYRYGSGLESDSTARVSNVLLESGLDELTLDASRYLVHPYGSGLEAAPSTALAYGSGLEEPEPVSASSVFMQSGLEIPGLPLASRPSTLEERYGSGL